MQLLCRLLLLATERILVEFVMNLIVLLILLSIIFLTLLFHLTPDVIYTILVFE